MFDIADKIIADAYPGKPGWWGSKRIPNYGILRGAIAAALESGTQPASDNTRYATALEVVEEYAKWRKHNGVDGGIEAYCKQRLNADGTSHS